MKIRLGYVSNSSSSSFIISLDDITEEQVQQILNFNKLVVEYGLCNEDEVGGDYCWYIKLGRKWVKGSTSDMGSGAMYEFLYKIGVPNDVVEWDY